MKYISGSNLEKIIRQDYAKSILFDRKDFDYSGNLLQIVEIPPHTLQRKHFHNIQTEVYYILEGECKLVINDQEFIAKPGDAFIAEPKDVHHLHNESDITFKLIVFKINYPDEGEDSVWLE